MRIKKKSLMGSKATAYADKFIHGYVIFLFLFIVMLQLGLNGILATNLQLEPPRLVIPETTTPDACTPEGIQEAIEAGLLEGVATQLDCFLRGTIDVVDSLFRIVSFVFANLGFFIQLSTLNPVTGLLSLIFFGPAAVMVILWVLRIVRGGN